MEFALHANNVRTLLKCLELAVVILLKAPANEKKDTAYVYASLVQLSHLRYLATRQHILWREVLQKDAAAFDEEPIEIAFGCLARRMVSTRGASKTDFEKTREAFTSMGARSFYYNEVEQHLKGKRVVARTNVRDLKQPGEVRRPFISAIKSGLIEMVGLIVADQWDCLRTADLPDGSLQFRGGGRAGFSSLSFPGATWKKRSPLSRYSTPKDFGSLSLSGSDWHSKLSEYIIYAVDLSTKLSADMKKALPRFFSGVVFFPRPGPPRSMVMPPRSDPRLWYGSHGLRPGDHVRIRRLGRSVPQSYVVVGSFSISPATLDTPPTTLRVICFPDLPAGHHTRPAADLSHPRHRIRTILVASAACTELRLSGHSAAADRVPLVSAITERWRMNFYRHAPGPLVNLVGVS